MQGQSSDRGEGRGSVELNKQAAALFGSIYASDMALMSAEQIVL
jgi:hypothetical protein